MDQLKKEEDTTQEVVHQRGQGSVALSSLASAPRSLPERTAKTSTKPFTEPHELPRISVKESDRDLVC